MVLRCGLKQWQTCSSKHLFSPCCSQNLRTTLSSQSSGTNLCLSHHTGGINLDRPKVYRTLSLTGDNKIKRWKSKAFRGDMETEGGPDSTKGFVLPHYADLQLDRADHVRQVVYIALPNAHHPITSARAWSIGGQSCRIQHSWKTQMSCKMRFVRCCDSWSHALYVVVIPGANNRS